MVSDFFYHGFLHAKRRYGLRVSELFWENHSDIQINVENVRIQLENSKYTNEIEYLKGLF